MKGTIVAGIESERTCFDNDPIKGKVLAAQKAESELEHKDPEAVRLLTHTKVAETR